MVRNPPEMQVCLVSAMIDDFDSCQNERHFCQWLVQMLLLSAVALPLAVSAGLLAWKYAPVSDPIEVVGVPLLEGTSQAAEDTGFRVYFVSAIVFGALTGLWTNHLRIRIPAPKALATVLIATLVWLWMFLVAGITWRYPLTIIAAWIAGWLFAEAAPLSLINFLYLTGVAAILGQSKSALNILRDTILSPVVLPMLVGVAGLIAILIWRDLWSMRTWYRKLHIEIAATKTGRRHQLALAAFLAFLLTLDTGTRLMAVFAAGTSWWAMLAVHQHARPRTLPLAARFVLDNAPGLTCIVAGVAFIQNSIYSVEFHRLIVGTATAVMLAIMLREPALQYMNSLKTQCVTHGWEKTGLRGVLIAAAAMTMLQFFWLGLTATVLVIWLSRGVVQSPGGFRTASIVAVVTFLMFLPLPEDSMEVDSFHDGQILSARTELANGRSLFSEVFPLRGYHLCLSLVSGYLVSPTIEGFHMTMSAVSMLPAAAAAFVTFLWTRSLAWSLLSAAAAFTCAFNPVQTSMLASRQSTHLIAIGLCLGTLQLRGVLMRCLASAGTGLWTAAMGFDQFVAIAIALPAAVWLLEFTPRTRCQGLLRASLHALMTFTCYVAAPTVTLATFEGAASATAFWQLLIDNARFLPAFYGHPLHSLNEMSRPTLIGVLICGAWLILGAACLPQMTSEKRSRWALIGIGFAVIMSQIPGRRSGSSLTQLAQPVVLMLSLGLFEALCFARRSGIRRLATNRTLVPLALTLLLLLSTERNRLTNPADFIIRLASLSQRETVLPQHPELLKLVDPDQSLWTVENALENYLVRRRNPTRHAIAYCISSPREQAVAVRMMQRDPPAAILLDDGPITATPASLRYFVISQFLFENYRPSAYPGVLIPQDHSWTGLSRLMPEFSYPLHCGQLPLVWGRHRWRTVQSNLKLEVRATGAATAAVSTPSFEPIDPRSGNYLEIRLLVESVAPMPGPSAEVTVTFSSPGAEVDELNTITFMALADGHAHHYFVPLGCSPGWSWKSTVEQLRLQCCDDYRLQCLSANLQRIDEMQPYTAR